MTDQPRPAGAVFISYAREDSEAARRIAEALRAFGVEVWFDLSELRGGDAWDVKIKKQIRECTLFIPIISANTQAREEGYFRREWRMAVDRTHDMAENRAFIVPVLVDDTKETDANVPEQFLKAHCTRLEGGEPTPQFIEQVKRLLSGLRAATTSKPVTRAPTIAPAKSKFSLVTAGLGAAVVALLAFVFLRPGPKPEPGPTPAAPVMAEKASEPSAAPVSAASAKSIAVLPFVNMSTDADQGFFADGLAEELLNLLTKIPTLQVTSRSSAFFYKGKDIKLAQVARELNVAHVLEGSVRKSGNRLRITAQLIDARTDKHLWSETYDRSLDDIFVVQDEIAAAVVGQLKITLLGAAPKARVADPKAYALFLQARQLARQGTPESLGQAIGLDQQALVLDPTLAAAWDGLAYCYVNQADNLLRASEDGYRLGLEAVNKALAIDPALAVAHARLGYIIRGTSGDLAAAARQYEQALAIDPANVEIISEAMLLARNLGRFEQAAALAEFVVAHDPMNAPGYARLGTVYLLLGRIDESIASYRTALRLSPGRPQSHFAIGRALLSKGDLPGALAASQQETSEVWRLDGLVATYHALGQKAQSDAALAELIRKYEKESSWNIAYLYADRGEADHAFEWLDKAVDNHDPGLDDTAITWLFNGIRQDPRWLPFLRKIGRAPEQLATIKFDVKLPER